MTDTATIIAKIRKNASEELRVSLTQYKNQQLVDLRVYADIERNGELVATRKGICCISKISAIIEALQDAQAEAVRRGLFREPARQERRQRWWDQ